MYFSNLLSKIDYFFAKYNYKTFFFSFYDNYLPGFLVAPVNFIILVFYKIVNLTASLLLNLYGIWGNFFFILETTIATSTNSLVAKSISIALKFILAIAFLIFARGGIPRFRFDYLTRLG